MCRCYGTGLHREHHREDQRLWHVEMESDCDKQETGEELMRALFPLHMCVRVCLRAPWSVEHNFCARQGTLTVHAGEAGSAAPALVCRATLHATVNSPCISGRSSLEGGRELKQLLVCACTSANVRATLHHARRTYKCTRPRTPLGYVHLRVRVCQCVCLCGVEHSFCALGKHCLFNWRSQQRRTTQT